MLIGCFAIIVIQDTRDRLVYGFLYILAALLCTAIQLKINGLQRTMATSLVNLFFVAVILLAAYAYTKLKMRHRFYNKAIGSGDLFLLFGLCFSFSTVPFIVMLVFSLVFSLMLHQFIKNPKHTTIPLAGYMSVFFGAVYLVSFFLPNKYLYS